MGPLLLDRRRTLLGAGLAALAAALPGGLAAAEGEPRRLVLAFIPQENPEKLLGDIDAIAAFLGEQLGVEVEGFVTFDHAAAIEALGAGQADISFAGALPYVLAHDHVGAEVLLSEIYRGKASYTSRIFVRKDSGIAAIEDLRDRSIAFADPISESGYLYPLDVFAKAGLLQAGGDPQDFFGRVYFAGGYQQAIQAVANGLVDAAGVSEFADLLLTPEQRSQVYWIAESTPIPSHAVIARPGLDPALKQAFIQAMLKLNEPVHRDMLRHVYSPDGYIKADPEAYEPVAEVARRYGLLS
jgi:phosphonate transport system substrate-binding protein